MRILNIGFDKTLVGGAGYGDAVGRHRIYGEYLDSLDIIVYTNKKEKLKKFKISEKVTGYPTNSLGKLFFVRDAVRIGREISKTHKFDIIVCQDPFTAGLAGVMLKRETRAKLQINFHGDFWGNPWWLHERWYNFLFFWLSKYAVPKADAVRVMSVGQKKKLVDAGIFEEKIRVISTPVNIERFANFEAMATPEQTKMLKTYRSASGPKAVILTVTKSEPSKGLDVLAKVAENVRRRKGKDNVFFSVAGANSTDWADRKGGKVDSKDLPVYYYSSDIVVLPSYSESFGKVLVEANACGKPVVATATTGAKEIVRDGYNGFLVPIADHKALAEKIIYFLDHPDVAKQMGENGKKLVRERFANNTQEIIRLWQDILSGKI